MFVLNACGKVFKEQSKRIFINLSKINSLLGKDLFDETYHSVNEFIFHSDKKNLVETREQLVYSFLALSSLSSREAFFLPSVGFLYRKQPPQLVLLITDCFDSLFVVKCRYPG